MGISKINFDRVYISKLIYRQHGIYYTDKKHLRNKIYLEIFLVQVF